jgi:hypothetical protein
MNSAYVINVNTNQIHFFDDAGARLGTWQAPPYTNPQTLAELAPLIAICLKAIGATL